MISLVVDNGPAGSITHQRRALLAQVHVARKALAMEEDDYRAVMERVTGHVSAKECNDNQLRDAIAKFERLGFRPAERAPRRIVGGSQTVRKARAMWISLYQLGAIDDRSDAALESFGRRQLHVERLVWANERQGFRLIEALKAIADRHGWDQRISTRMPARDRIRLLKDRLVAAQIARLEAAGIEIRGPLSGDRTAWSDDLLQSAAAELGRRVRSLTNARIVS